MPQSVPSPRSSTAIILLYLLLFAGVAAAIFLAGSLEEGGEGIFLLLAGISLIGCPSRVQLPRGVWIVSGAFVACCGLALLPLQSLAQQSWRGRFNQLPVDLGNLVTPIPSESLFWLAIVALSTVLLLFIIAHPLRSKTVLVLTTVGTLICSAYAGLSILAYKTGWKYPCDVNESFGFFPNRNHTAAFLITGCLLALGLLGVAKKHWLAGLAAVTGWAVCGTALLVYSASRGGVVFLVFGILIWLAGLGRERWSKPLLISFAALFLAGTAFFLVAKSEARNRLLKQAGWGESETSKPASVDRTVSKLPEDGRIFIYKDTWRMILDAPLTGVGLGAFRYVYPQYRNFSLAESTSLHPESDWLMLAAEAGLPALFLAVAGGLMLLKRAGSQRAHPYWPLRWGVLCAALAAMSYGFADVPMHRLALSWWIFLFAGIGLQIPASDNSRVNLGQRAIFWVAGVGALALGGWMILSQWFGSASTPPFAAQKNELQIIALYKKGDLEPANDLASRAIRTSPMLHRLYYLKGLLELCFDGTEPSVDRYFAAERALNPDWTQVPVQQGEAWLSVDTARTLDLWKDALRRSEQLDRARQSGQKATLATFENLLQKSGKYPDLQRRLNAVTKQNAAMTLVWLRMVAADLAAERIPEISQNAQLLQSMQAAEKAAFLRSWYEKGNRDALFSFVEATPDWEAIARPLKIRRMVDAKEFQQAVQTVLEHEHLDFSLPAPGTDKPLSYHEPGSDPVLDFDHYWKAGNEVSARRIIEEARLAAEKSTKRSPEIWKISASLALHDQKWEIAWRDLQRYLRDAGHDPGF